MHLDDLTIQRLYDGELEALDESTAQSHLMDCVPCANRAEDARGERRQIQALLGTLDGPSRRIDLATIFARADSTPRWTLDRFAGLRKAAAVLLVVGLAGVVYALPGSPVRTWVRGVVRTMTPKPRPEPDRARPPQEAGISILPEERLVILFRLGAARGNGLASLSLTDGSEVQVHAPPGAATYSSVPGRLEIEVRDLAAPFVVQVPRSAPWVEIRVDETSLFLKDRTRITTSSPAGPGDRYILPLERRSPEPAR